jgi:hypothetical protein
MWSYFDFHILKIQLKTSQLVNLEKVQHIKSIIEQKMAYDDVQKFQHFEPQELNDFYKILQICEFILEKYKDKKELSQNLKKFVSIIDSTLINLESLDEEINELTVSADFSLKKIQDFKSNLIKSEGNPIYLDY